MSKTYRLTLLALFLALGLILPQLFHLIGGAGPALLPMHIPVLLGGFLLGPLAGFTLGLITPILSSLLTGMPPVPVLYFMIVELAVYGLMAGFFYRRLKLNSYVALILAMIAGRIMLAVTVFALQIQLGLKINPSQYMIGALTTGILGMVLQIVVIPPLVKILDRRIKHNY